MDFVVLDRRGLRSDLCNKKRWLVAEDRRDRWHQLHRHSLAISAMQQLDLVHVRVAQDQETDDVAELCKRVTECSAAQKRLRLFDIACLARREEIAVIRVVDVDARRNVRHHPHQLTVRAHLRELLAQPRNLLRGGRGIWLAVTTSVRQGLEDVLQYNEARVVHRAGQHHAVVAKTGYAVGQRRTRLGVRDCRSKTRRSGLEKGAVGRLKVVGTSRVVVAEREIDRHGSIETVNLLRNKRKRLSGERRVLSRSG